MSVSKLSSREFNQDTSGAKRAAESGAVVITDRGRPTHVLLSYRDYQRLVGRPGEIIEWLGLPEGIADVELEIPTARDTARAAELG
ncbi:MAG TPA: type II toxin-antitoxin system Phd/YefM family antitoxin [Thermoanaerobaculia bacterium]|nr:type II toxin-antitoxin system Phd/YefM family antitoxin [Thermoanaerobaculia bacterium]